MFPIHRINKASHTESISPHLPTTCHTSLITGAHKLPAEINKKSTNWVTSLLPTVNMNIDALMWFVLYTNDSAGRSIYTDDATQAKTSAIAQLDCSDISPYITHQIEPLQSHVFDRMLLKWRISSERFTTSLFLWLYSLSFTNISQALFQAEGKPIVWKVHMVSQNKTASLCKVYLVHISKSISLTMFIDLFLYDHSKLKTKEKLYKCLTTERTFVKWKLRTFCSIICITRNAIDI